MSLTKLLSRKTRFALGLAGLLLASSASCGQKPKTEESTYEETTSGGADSGNGSEQSGEGSSNTGSNYPSSDGDSSNTNDSESGGVDDYYEEDYSTSTFFIDDVDPISAATSAIGSWADDEIASGADYGGCPVHSCITSPEPRSTNWVDILGAVYVVVKDGERAVSGLDARVARDTAELNRAYSSMNVQFNTAYYSVTELDHPEWWDVTNDEFDNMLNAVKNDDAQPWWPIVYVRTINGGAHAGQAYQCSNRGIVLARSAPAQTAAHEFGHQMCLYHTHEASCGEEACEGSSCDTSGDFICDTLADRTYDGCSESGCSKTCGGRCANRQLYVISWLLQRYVYGTPARCYEVLAEQQIKQWHLLS
ncbi:hypothetical protein HYU19_02735 [Candidatus Woesearchaeota archaeon]|nr:hypothetical protein [Candidatus Woesearchaeota archaeon]